MFGMGGSEIIVILVIALIFLGPDKLPDAAKSLSKGIRDLRGATVTINGSLTSLWENNLVAILAEAEFGWVVNDTDAFVRLTNASGS